MRAADGTVELELVWFTHGAWVLAFVPRSFPLVGSILDKITRDSLREVLPLLVGDSHKLSSPYLQPKMTLVIG